MEHWKQRENVGSSFPDSNMLDTHTGELMKINSNKSIQESSNANVLISNEVTENYETLDFHSKEVSNVIKGLKDLKK